MKFLSGFILGVVSCFLILSIAGKVMQEPVNEDGLTLFSVPKDCVTRKNLKVFQALPNGRALAREVNASFDSPVMYLVGTEGETFYDDEIVKLPGKQCAMQIGTYFYQTKNKDYKTVPAVSISWQE